MSETSFTPRVFSGIQPSGGLTLGNYLGALRNWVSGQHEKDVFHGVVDLHALTVTEEPGITAPAAAGSGARIAFRPDAAEAEIRALLLSVEAEITAGPSAIGLWQLGFADDARRDAALSQLRARPDIVESVQPD